MAKICEFPDDGKLWLIKWVDEFYLPHLGTSSASVTVLLQELPFADPNQLRRLKQDELYTIWGRKKDGSDTIFCEIENNGRPRVHVGLMPVLAVGSVYQNQELVGELPASFVQIELPEVEASCTETTLQAAYPPPPTWKQGLPHRLLNDYDFIGVRSRFGRSRCLVFHDNNTDYIIPRTVIFKRFYACHSDLAGAFTNGHWPEQQKTLIFPGTTASGQTTGVDADTKEWHIVLMPKIPDDYIFFLATYYFDLYGAICANAVYAQALSDCQANPEGCSYASAKIPFQASDTLFKLDIKGYYLKPHGFQKETAKRKFLVTSIRGCSLPSYLQPISKGRVNSGDAGAELEHSDKPAPYGNSSPDRPAGENTTVSSQFDAHARTEARNLPTDDFFLIDPPQVKKLTKETSTRYQPGNKPTLQDKDPDQTSAGNENQRKSSQTKAKAASRQREVSKRFEALIAAMTLLQEKEDITSFSVFAPFKEIERTPRSNRHCWNFLTELSRQSGVWPKKHWRMIKPAITEENGYSNGIPRAALVLEIITPKLTGYWIEIEVKNSSYYSPFLYDIAGDAINVVREAVEIIAKHQGSKLGPPLQNGVDRHGGGSVALYRHHLKNESDGGFNIKKMKQFLKAPERFDVPRLVEKKASGQN